jgi:hypothetical protein
LADAENPFDVPGDLAELPYARRYGTQHPRGAQELQGASDCLDIFLEQSCGE